jgi:peroxiredoxin
VTRGAAAALALSAWLQGCAHVPEGADRLPVLDLPAVGPEPWRAEDAEGRVVVVMFLATWCFPCLSDLATLRVLQERYGAQGVQVVVLGLDREGRKVLEPFAYSYKLPFPVLVADGWIRSGESRFGKVHAVPQGMVFDRDGKIVSAWRGPLSAERLEGELRRVLQR